MNTVTRDWNKHSVTTARYDMDVSNNGTWSNAFQFGDPDDTTWSLTGATFECDVQRNPYDTVPLLSVSTTNSKIVVADAIQRVLYFSVPAAEIQASLTPGTYVYDLVMIDPLGVRTPLLYGCLTIVQGITYP